MALKQVIVVRTDLKMGRGKIAAQSAHASIAVIRDLPPAIFGTWYAQGMKKIVLKVKGKKELFDLYKIAKKNFPAAIINDAGLTQIKKGAPTCIAIGPAEEASLDRLTGKLKLL